MSLLMNGLKYTLALSGLLTLLRFFFALPLGLWSGITGRGRGFLRAMQWVISAVPAFLLLFPTLGGMFFGLGLNEKSAEPQDMMLFMIVFLLLVTIHGVFPLAYQISERAQFYNQKPYVEASRLMGSSFFHRIVTHILSSMRLELVFTLISEFILILFLMGQLAIFNIILGRTKTRA
ncbi:ABC transporter permease subunit [Cohnella luojiensis]|uniref:ABC transporter permease subunit n=1 Tax=Cohnella luojiensis TaxID=652876 RepID=A0A4Y8M6B0_9BACL|nr:ABC transporter permease subunit [Cohnella luojiensis]TFE31510.1 ABC transporter permease subunit [Cohnella luojiensis]